jgi:hypothetical protein
MYDQPAIGQQSNKSPDAIGYRDLFLRFTQEFERILQSKDSPESVVGELRKQAAFAAQHFRGAEQLPGEAIPRGIRNAPGIPLSEWWLAPRPDELPVPFTHCETDEPSSKQIEAWSRVWVTILRNIATTYPRLLKGGEEVGGSRNAMDFKIRVESREQFARSSADACRVVAGWLAGATRANTDGNAEDNEQITKFSMGDVLAIAEAVKNYVSHTELDDLLAFGSSDDPGSSEGKTKRLRAVLRRSADSLEGRSRIVALVENIASARRQDDRLLQLCQSVNGIIVAHGLRLDLDCKIRSQQITPPQSAPMHPIRLNPESPVQVEIVGLSEGVREAMLSGSADIATGKKTRRQKRTEAQIAEDEGKIAGFLIEHSEATRDQTAEGTEVAQAHVSASMAWKAHREQRGEARKANNAAKQGIGGVGDPSTDLGRCD